MAWPSDTYSYTYPAGRLVPVPPATRRGRVVIKGGNVKQIDWHKVRRAMRALAPSPQVQVTLKAAAAAIKRSVR